MVPVALALQAYSFVLLALQASNPGGDSPVPPQPPKLSPTYAFSWDLPKTKECLPGWELACSFSDELRFLWHDPREPLCLAAIGGLSPSLSFWNWEGGGVSGAPPGSFVGASGLSLNASGQGANLVAFEKSVRMVLEIYGLTSPTADCQFISDVPQFCSWKPGWLDETTTEPACLRGAGPCWLRR